MHSLETIAEPTTTSIAAIIPKTSSAFASLAKGNMKPQQMKTSRAIPRAMSLRPKTGTLRLVLKQRPQDLKWTQGQKTVGLVRVALDFNTMIASIYNEFGVYTGERLGTPCATIQRSRIRERVGAMTARSTQKELAFPSIQRFRPSLLPTGMRCLNPILHRFCHGPIWVLNRLAASVNRLAGCRFTSWFISSTMHATPTDS